MLQNYPRVAHTVITHAVVLVFIFIYWVSMSLSFINQLLWLQKQLKSICVDSCFCIQKTNNILWNNFFFHYFLGSIILICNHYPSIFDNLKVSTITRIFAIDLHNDINQQWYNNTNQIKRLLCTAGCLKERYLFLCKSSSKSQMKPSAVHSERGHLMISHPKKKGLLEKEK